MTAKWRRLRPLPVHARMRVHEVKGHMHTPPPLLPPKRSALLLLTFSVQRVIEWSSYFSFTLAGPVALRHTLPQGPANAQIQNTHVHTHTHTCMSPSLLGRIIPFVWSSKQSANPMNYYNPVRHLGCDSTGRSVCPSMLVCVWRFHLTVKLHVRWNSHTLPNPPLKCS